MPSKQCPGSGLSYDAPADVKEGACPHCGATVRLVKSLLAPAFEGAPTRFLAGHKEAVREAAEAQARRVQDTLDRLGVEAVVTVREVEA